jgi:serine/threonine protein kinase
MARILMPNEAIDPNGYYSVVDDIASCGEGTTYMVVDSRMGHEMVVKVIDASKAQDPKAARERLFERNQLQFDHPCVIASRDSGRMADGTPYVAYPLLAGYRRIETMVPGGQLVTSGLGSIVWVLYQLFSGLLAIHHKGYVHGDIKPSNVLVCPVSFRLMVIDLGLATQVGSKRSANDGSLEWKAPERFLGVEADPRTDQAEAGYLAYYCLTGQPPYDRADVGKSLKARQLRPVHELAPAIPRDISDAICRATDDDIQRRFESLEPLLAVLRPYLPAEHRAGCQQCQFVKDGKFCSRCGRHLEDTGNRYRCAACGSKLTAGVSSCSGCGRQIHRSSPRMVYDGGILSGMTLLLPEGCYVAGRQTIEPRHHGISRTHLRLEVSGGHVTVSDAQARKPMKINGRPIAGPVSLIPNTPISLAGCSGNFIWG